MDTSMGVHDNFEGVAKRSALRVWLRLFLGIGGGAVAIALALGLVVVLTASAAQAQPVNAGGAAVSDAVSDAVAGAVAGMAIISLGFRFLLSRRGSRFLAGGAPEPVIGRRRSVARDHEID